MVPHTGQTVSYTRKQASMNKDACPLGTMSPTASGAGSASILVCLPMLKGANLVRRSMTNRRTQDDVPQ